MFVSGLIPVYICLIQAAAVNHIPAEIITSIISVEGGRHGLAVANKNNTEDLGIGHNADQYRCLVIFGQQSFF